MGVVQDNEVHSPDAWKKDLRDAGWAEFAATASGKIPKAAYGVVHTVHGASFRNGKAKWVRNNQ